MSDAQNIQWFPGHMTKTRRQIEAQLKIIDAVAEIVDARIPVSSRNPDLAGIIADKPHLILLKRQPMNGFLTMPLKKYLQLQLIAEAVRVLIILRMRLKICFRINCVLMLKRVWLANRFVL